MRVRQSNRALGRQMEKADGRWRKEIAKQPPAKRWSYAEENGSSLFAVEGIRRDEECPRRVPAGQFEHSPAFQHQGIGAVGNPSAGRVNSA